MTPDFSSVSTPSVPDFSSVADALSTGEKTPDLQPPEQSSTQPQEKSFGRQAIDTALWLSSPFTAFGDFALAPLAHKYESKDAIGQLGEAFQVGADAFQERLFPTFGEPVHNYAGDVLKDVDMPDALRPTAEMALMMVTDPTVLVSGGFASTLRKSINLAAKTGDLESPFSSALKEFVSVVPMSSQEAIHYAKLAKQADGGDQKATQELLDAFGKRADDVEAQVAAREQAAASNAAEGGLKVEADVSVPNPIQAVEPNASIKDIERVVANIEAKNPETLANAKLMDGLDKVKLKARVNVMKGVQKTRAKAERSLLKESKAEASTMMDEHPVYRLIAKLKEKGVNPEGLPADMVERLKVHGVIKKNGVSIIASAQRHGFDDSVSMFDSLSRIGSKKSAIKQLADEAFRFNEPELKGLSDLDMQSKFIDEEARLLGIKFESKGIKKVVRENTGQTRISKMVTEEAALKASFKKAEQAARIAFREGKKEGYTNLKIKFDAYKEAVMARKGTTRAIKKIDRVLRHKAIPEDYMEQIQAILGDLRPIPKKDKTQAPAKNIGEWLTDKADEGDVMFADSMRVLIDDLPTSRDLGSLTPGELVKIRQVVEAMEEVGILEKKFADAKHEGDFANVIASARLSMDSLLPDVGIKKTASQLAEASGKPGVQGRVARLGTLMKSWGDKTTSTQREFIASIDRPKFIPIALDGEVLDGPVTRLLERPIRQANDAEIILHEKVDAELEKAYAPFKKNWEKWHTEVLPFTREDGTVWKIDKQTRIMVALNNGNSGNRELLMTHFNLTEKDITRLVSELSGKESKMVDDLFTIAGQFFEESSRINKILTGRRLEAVDGKYFAIVTDPKAARSGNILEKAFEKGQERDLFSTLRRRPSSKTKGTQRIARTGGAGPLLLKFEAIDKQLNNTIHDVTHALQVRDVQKVLSNKEFRATATAKIGVDMYNQLVTSLQHVARPVREGMSMAERGVQIARSNTTVAILGANASVGLKQTLSLTQTMHEIGGVPVLKEVAAQWLNRGYFRRQKAFVDSISPSIRARGKTMDREFMDMALTFLPQKYRDMWFSWIRWNDRQAVYPSYMAAYKQEMKKTNDPEKARLFAEDIVELTQPINQAKDLPATLRGNQFERSFKSFMSFFSVMFNQFARSARKRGLLRAEGRNLKAAGELAKTYWYLWFVPSYLALTIDKKRPPTVKETIVGMAGFRAAGIPYVRDVYNLAFTQFGSDINPTAGKIKDVGRAAGDLVNWEDPEEAMKALATVIGFFAATPVTPFIRAAEGIDDLNKHNTKFFLAPLLGDVVKEDEFDALK